MIDRKHHFPLLVASLISTVLGIAYHAYGHYTVCEDVDYCWAGALAVIWLATVAAVGAAIALAVLIAPIDDVLQREYDYWKKHRG